MANSAVRETYRGVKSLPVETLSRALSFLFARACFGDIEAVRVRYLRHELCGDPACWSQFYVSLRMPTDVLIKWLERVGQTTFALTMDFKYDRGQHFADACIRLEESFGALHHYMDRCHALSIRVGGGKLCDRLFSLLLPVPFPSMTHLDLDVNFAFELSGDWTPLLKGITTVKTCCNRRFLSAHNWRIFIQFLSAIPDLEFLILHNVDCLLPPQFYKDDPPVVPRSEPMPFLARLEVSSDNPMHTWLLASIDAPAIAHLTLHSASESMLTLLPRRCDRLLASVVRLVLWSPVTKPSVIGDLFRAMPSLQALDGRYATFSFSAVFYMLAMQCQQLCPQLEQVVLSHIGIASEVVDAALNKFAKRLQTLLQSMLAELFDLESDWAQLSSPVLAPASWDFRQDRTRILLVCKYWHQLALNDPLLWSTVTISHITSHSTLERIINVTSGQSLGVYILDLRVTDSLDSALDFSTMLNLFDLIAPTSNRWIELVVVTPSVHVRAHVLDKARDLPCSRLRSMTIQGPVTLLLPSPPPISRGN
ncbi:hypothetical protein R3P38DRAFT_3237787 [Favolaschia claudopus]|uniref:F-box domain-containing protein n=1 Tax=Favolaschia claudopus TaxID=2862362 RepID=A0AAV9ZAV0_9AGAR